MLVDNEKISSALNFCQSWKEILAKSIVSVDQLEKYFDIDSAGLQNVTSLYPMRINPYFLSLIQKKNDAIWKQAVPDVKEIESDFYSDDPLFEEIQSPVPNLIHRYPGRVLFMVSNQCAMFCRYCMRKRKLGSSQPINSKSINNGIAYIRKNNNINEVILSGGDPLLLDDDVINWILMQLRAIPHIDIIRIHTRTPSSLPQRVTFALVNIIKKYHPVYINTHFNHPTEITGAAAEACIRLADAGIPLGCQTVLLKGVNDNEAVMRELMLKLLRLRVKPYYLHQVDLVKGAAHFRTSVQTGIDILKRLQTDASSLCIPSYMIDLPGGYGKIPLQPEYVKDLKQKVDCP
ncbi:MAG: KamA family radical SAM protein [Desulfobacterales bacterium]|nr:KamA family radical SAM protein [Desulfobacterales bacterium]